MAGIRMRKNEREIFENPDLIMDLKYDRSSDAIASWYKAKYEAYKAAQAAKKAK